MACIFVIVPGITSVLHANLALAARLQRAGHRVALASPADVGEAVRRGGMEFVALEAPRAVAREPSDAAKLVRWLRRWTQRQARMRQRVDALAMDGFAQRIGARAPDLVLVDIEMAEYVIAAWSLPCRVGLVSTFLSIWKCPRQPPLHRLITPGVGWRGSKMGIELAWLSLRLWKWSMHTRDYLRSGGVDRLSVLRHLARERGFPFRRLVERHDYLMPYSYNSLPVLTLNASELDFPMSQASARCYVGPMVWCSSSGKADTRLTALLERFGESAAGGKKLVYCGFGSFASSYELDFLERVTRSAEGRSWELVITLGGSANVISVPDTPQNVHVFDWVPQIQVLSVASCAIVHAGMITINECLHFGVPMLLYPMVVDQFGNAARIAFHGLGIVGDRCADAPDTIAGHVDQLLVDPTLAARMSSMRERLHRYERDAVAERAVDEMLRVCHE